MRKLRHTVVKSIAQIHMVRKWQNQDVRAQPVQFQKMAHNQAGNTAYFRT